MASERDTTTILLKTTEKSWSSGLRSGRVPDSILPPHTSLYVLTSHSVISCSGEIPYRALGCFRDDHNLYRPLPEQLFSDPQEKIDFKDWPNYLSDVICR